MATTKVLVPLEDGEELKRQLEVYDDTVPTKVLDEASLEQQIAQITQQEADLATRKADLQADLDLINAEVAKE